MPFTPVSAPVIDLLQNAVDGAVYIPSFSRKSFLKDATSGLLSNAPALTMVGNLLTVSAPVRNYDLNAFAGAGLSIETTTAAGNAPSVARRTIQSFTTASTTQAYAYPANLSIGQLLIVAVATAALTTITTPAGWTLEGSQAGTESRLSVYSRVIDGTETGETLTFGTASGALVRSWAVDIAHGDVETLTGLNDSAAGTSLDLATISPTWAVSEAHNTLYLSLLALANDVTISAFPAGYTVTGQDANVSGTANIDCALGYAELSALGSSENPGAFTYAASRSTGMVVAIRPAITARMNWDGLAVRKAGVLIGTQRAVNLIEGAGATLTVTNNVGTGAVDITVAASGGLSSQAADTFLGRLAGAGVPTAQLLTDIDSTSIIYDVTSHTFQVAAASGGDITKAQNSNTYTVNNDSITYAKIQNVVNNNRFLGRISGAGGDVEELTGTQATTLLDTFTSALKGLVPLSGGGTVNFLRADGTWAAPPGTNTAGHIIRVNGAAFTQRAAVNLLNTTAITVAGNDDSVGGETELTFTLGAHTGDVTSVANSLALTIANDAVSNAKAANMPAISIKANPTASAADPQDMVATAVRQVPQLNNGGTALQWGDPNQLYDSALALQGDWYQLRALNGTHTTSTASVTTRGANVSWSVNLSTLVPAIDSVSVVANGTVLERAAITGAVALGQNSNQSVFSGIRFNGAATTDRTNLNFINGTRTTVSLADDSINDEIEITYNWNGAGLYQSDLTTFVKNFLDLAPIDGDSIQGIATNPGGNGGGLQYNYVGTTSEIPKASATGNLGTIDISSLKCGGSYRVTSASSSFSIEGFTAKTAGFWFQFFYDELAGGDECTFFHEDATATAANRLSMPGRKDLTNRGIRGIFIYGGNARWNFVSPDPARIGTTNNYMKADDGSAAEIVTASTDVNITAGGTASVNIVAGNDVALTASNGVGSNGDLLFSGDNMVLTRCVPRSDFGTLGTSALASWGPVFLLYRAVTAGTPGAAGDSTFFNADAPFAFRVILCGCDITTGSGAGDTVTFRNATGGGGSAVCAAMPTNVAGQAIGNSITALAGAGTIAAGGTLVARWTDRAAVGTVWALCMRLS